MFVCLSVFFFFCNCSVFVPACRPVLRLPFRPLCQAFVLSILDKKQWCFFPNKTKLFAYPQNITRIRGPSLKGVWHVIAWRTNNKRLSTKFGNFAATKMFRIYLFTSSLVRCRRIEAKKCLRLSRIAMFLQGHPGIVQIGYSFGKHCWSEDSEDDYFEQKIGIKPHLQPLDLQGELLILIFCLTGC